MGIFNLLAFLTCHSVGEVSVQMDVCSVAYCYNIVLYLLLVLQPSVGLVGGCPRIMSFIQDK